MEGKQPIKSPNDKNSYKIVKLTNKLEALLISSPDADKAAASLSVEVGQLDDPVEYQGMAHYLEHMLFLGTEKYPSDGDYDAYLNKNAGYNNAYTAETHTNYYFECSNDAFEGALDRFAQFFIKPLFTEDCSERELNAVNSENEMCSVDDQFREYTLQRSMGLKSTSYWQFGVGSVKSLKKPGLRENLMKFYQAHYSANLMRLALISKDSLETLEKWVLEKFTAIQNNEKELFRHKVIPFDNTNLAKLVRLVPVKDQDFLLFQWMIPDTEKYYKSDPLKYLTHLLGHEGPNSLFSMLKVEGLAVSLTAGPAEEMHLFAFMEVRIRLTKKGLREWERVANCVFVYLNMLKEKGVQKWIFEELKAIKHLNFQFKEKEEPISYVEGLSPKMMSYPHEDLLRLNYLMEDYDEEHIKKITNSLTLDNLRLSLISRDLASDCDLTEEWYEIKYSVQDLPTWVYEAYKNPKFVPTNNKLKLDLPPKNIFLPTDLTILCPEDPSGLPKFPLKVHSTDYTELWFKQDNQFKVPKVRARCNIYDDYLLLTPKAYNIAKLWISLLTEHIRELGYQASMASSQAEVCLEQNFVLLDFGGFDSTFADFVHAILEKFLEFNPRDYESQFASILETEISDLKGEFKSAPYKQVSRIRSAVTKSGSSCFTTKEKYQAIHGITLEDVEAFHRQVFSTIYLEWLMVGNITKERAIKIVEDAESIFKKRGTNVQPLAKTAFTEVRCIDIPDNSHFVYDFYEFLPSKTASGHKDELEDEHNEAESDHQEKEVVHKEKKEEHAEHEEHKEGEHSCCDEEDDEGEEEEQPNCAIASYFQTTISNDETDLLCEVFDNYMNEFCYNELRTKQQLGYVVFAQTANVRGVLGHIITVQSDHKCPEYLSARILAFIDGMLERITQVTDEKFKAYIESVRQKKLVKRISFDDEIKHYFEELQNQQFIFDRNEREVERLATITREKVQQYAQEYLQKRRKLLEVHYIPSKFSVDNRDTRAASVTEGKTQKVVKTEAIEIRRMFKLHPDYYVSKEHTK